MSVLIEYTKLNIVVRLYLIHSLDITFYFLARDPYIMMLVVHGRQLENLPLKPPKNSDKILVTVHVPIHSSLALV